MEQEVLFKCYDVVSVESGNVIGTILSMMPDSNKENEGDKVVFRSKTFKIASTEIDSAGVCMKLYLIALSKGAWFMASYTGVWKKY